MVTANHWLRIVTFSVTLLFCHQLSAEIHRCRHPDGSIRFTDAVCKEGPTETVTLIMNSPLDSTAERANIVAYQAKKSEKTPTIIGPQVILIGDTPTEERNARIGEQKSVQTEHSDRKSKKRGKSKKKKTGKTTKNKKKKKSKKKKAKSKTDKSIN